MKLRLAWKVFRSYSRGTWERFRSPTRQRAMDKLRREKRVL